MAVIDIYYNQQVVNSFKCLITILWFLLINICDDEHIWIQGKGRSTSSIMIMMIVMF